LDKITGRCAVSGYSIREAIELAVQTERKGCEFYTEMAEKFKHDEEIGGLFARLAEKEQLHESSFRKLNDLIGGADPEGWEQVSDYMRAVVESAFFLGKDKATAHVRSIEDYPAAVSFAIAFEKETLLFFYAIRDAVGEKELLDSIINEEHSHIKWLNNFRRR
jgi:rubrerythrin